MPHSSPWGLSAWRCSRHGRTPAYLNVVGSGLSGNLVVVWKKLLLLQPLPHHTGNVLVERFLRKQRGEGLGIIHNGRKNKWKRNSGGWHDFVTYDRGVSAGLKFLLHGQKITGWLLSPGCRCAVWILTLKHINTISCKHFISALPRTLWEKSVMSLLLYKLEGAVCFHWKGGQWAPPPARRSVCSAAPPSGCWPCSGPGGTAGRWTPPGAAVPAARRARLEEHSEASAWEKKFNS